MDCLIGTDIGTTSTKTVAYDLNGRAIFKSEVFYNLLMPKIGMIEQDPDEILDSVLDSIKKVVSQIGKGKVAGITFSGAMHSVIPVDKNGNKLMNAMIWADTRSSQVAKELKESGEGFAIYKSTGTPIHPMLPLCKIIWLKSSKSIFKKASKFISIKEYVFYKLFGLYVIDHSMASGTGFLNLKSLKWDETALRIAGIGENMLSEIVPVDHVLKVKDLYAAKIGVDPEVPFIIGGADGPLSNLGSGAVKKGISCVSVGTSGAMRVISDTPFVDKKMRTFTYVLDESHFTIGGAVNNAGMAFKWFMDNFGGKIGSAMAKASKVRAGSDGLIFIPHLTGERSPYWDASLRGAFFGINIYHKRFHFLRAVLEGIGYSLYDVDLALEEISGKIDEVHLSGGMTRSKLWIKILADVLGKKVLTMKNNDSSAFGAAIVGMKALKIIDSLDEVKNFSLTSKTYFPDEENHDIYMKIFEIYKTLHDDLKKDFKNIVEFQEKGDKGGRTFT